MTALDPPLPEQREIEAPTEDMEDIAHSKKDDATSLVAPVVLDSVAETERATVAKTPPPLPTYDAEVASIQSGHQGPTLARASLPLSGRTSPVTPTSDTEVVSQERDVTEHDTVEPKASSSPLQTAPAIEVPEESEGDAMELEPDGGMQVSSPPSDTETTRSWELLQSNNETPSLNVADDLGGRGTPETTPRPISKLGDTCVDQKTPDAEQTAIVLAHSVAGYEDSVNRTTQPITHEEGGLIDAEPPHMQDHQELHPQSIVDNLTNQFGSDISLSKRDCEINQTSNVDMAEIQEEVKEQSAVDIPLPPSPTGSQDLLDVDISPSPPGEPLEASSTDESSGLVPPSAAPETHLIASDMEEGDQELDANPSTTHSEGASDSAESEEESGGEYEDQEPVTGSGELEGDSAIAILLSIPPANHDIGTSDQYPDNSRMEPAHPSDGGSTDSEAGHDSEDDRSASPISETAFMWPWRSLRAFTAWFTSTADKYDQLKKQIQDLLQQNRALEVQNRVLEINARAREQDLTARLHEAEQQYASLRNHLQLQDSREPREIVDPFKLIGQRIGNFCSDLSATISDSLEETFPDISSSTHAIHPEQLNTLLSTTSRLYVSPSGVGREVEDFIYFALLHALGTALKRELFDRFHPHISEPQDLHMRDVYKAIRDTDVQIKSGRWRSDTFKALDALCNPEELNEPWAQKFALDFESGFIAPLVTAICGSWNPSTISEKAREELLGIALLSYRWNRDTKAGFIPLDFHPVVFNGGIEFSADSMTVFGQRKTKSSNPSGPIISTAGLGLQSTLSYGTEKGIEDYWQLKAEVVMEEAF
ncbi:hypothetical protein BOTBODRAFT_176414 [Botryobasidium botryosum FD-172 SS1]|uniref:Uncharacterized protein n=1 Tax=Botryobasidium botryosum (strain FD-172 SS1) TaxID=930990 RepID=A0A067MA92_BOTB1|nr:hypothetical protein BOTBODRAFT_176414 [Botryobasidium botryosum FD-172 SS1]